MRFQHFTKTYHSESEKGVTQYILDKEWVSAIYTNQTDCIRWRSYLGESGSRIPANWDVPPPLKDWQVTDTRGNTVRNKWHVGRKAIPTTSSSLPIICVEINLWARWERLQLQSAKHLTATTFPPTHVTESVHGVWRRTLRNNVQSISDTEEEGG